MPAVSVGRRIAAVAKNETTYGTAPSLSQTTDAILLYTNMNPVATDTRMIDIVPLRESMTKLKSIVGRQLARFTGVTFLQGAAAGTPWRFGPLLRACGLKETVNAASSVVYDPRSSSFESVAMNFWLDGFKHIVTGAYGTFTMEAAAGEGVQVTWDVTGLYTEPTVDAIPTQTLETIQPVTFESAAGWIAGQGVIIKSFRFTMGTVVSERPDANSANALKGLRITDRDPRLDITVEVDTDFRNYFADLNAATTHSVSFQLGTASGNRMVFEAGQAQVLSMPYGENAGLRTFDLSYKIQHTTNDAEVKLTFN